jgi:hypothetical protein
LKTNIQKTSHFFCAFSDFSMEESDYDIMDDLMDDMEEKYISENERSSQDEGSTTSEKCSAINQDGKVERASSSDINVQLQTSNESTEFKDPLIFYHFSFQKADDSFVAGSVCMYWRVELTSPMQPLIFNGESIKRPAGTVFRPGDEVFVCSPRRHDATGKTFIIFGIFPDLKNPCNSHVLLIDEKPACVGNDKTLRSSPLNVVGLVPNGRCIDSTKSLLEDIYPIAKLLCETKLDTKNTNPFKELDFKSTNFQVEIKDRPKRVLNKKTKSRSGIRDPETTVRSFNQTREQE